MDVSREERWLMNVLGVSFTKAQCMLSEHPGWLDYIQSIERHLTLMGIGVVDTTSFRNEKYKTKGPADTAPDEKEIILQPDTTIVKCGNLYIESDFVEDGYSTKILVDGYEPRTKILEIKFEEGEAVWVKMTFLPDNDPNTPYLFAESGLDRDKRIRRQMEERKKFMESRRPDTPDVVQE